MQHINIDINFSELTDDHSLATDPTKADQLALFVRAYYSKKDWNQYQSMISSAIKAGNLLGLETLWQGVYHYDRNDRPDFQTDVYTAVEFGNLKMLQHVLYEYMNYKTFDQNEPLEYSQLLQLAAKNPDPEVLKMIEALVDSVNSIGQILSLCNEFLESIPEDDEEEEIKQERVLGQKFNQAIQKFVENSA